VANILYELQEQEVLDDYVLGALALGSSNDFFKPSSPDIQNIPVRIDFENTRPSDQGLVEITNARNEVIKKVFLVNAGLGVTSQANYLFNSPNRLIEFLKPRATHLAILLTAVLTILRHSNKAIKIRFQQKESRVQMSNLSITIIPYISGSFRYKDERGEGGFFDIYLCCNMGRMTLLKTLIDLSSGKFRVGRNRVIDRSRTVEVSSDIEMPLEVDGEIFMGHSFKFQLRMNAILLAS
jgi:diacylglycerol kinase family enzyme